MVDLARCSTPSSCGCARAPTRIDRTITFFLANGARYTALVFTFSAVLSTFGIATTSFVAVLGALGIAIGLALQGTLSNLAAGIMLVLFRPFHIGDRIEAGGVIGVVREVNLFYSEIDTDDNVRVIVPNGKLWGEIVKVPSRNETERVELKFTRPLSDDIETAIARVREIVGHDKRVTQMAQIGVDTVGDANYVLVARLWVPRRVRHAGPFRRQSRDHGGIPAPRPKTRRSPRRGLAGRRPMPLASRRCPFPSRSPPGSPRPSPSAARPCSPSAMSMAAHANSTSLLDTVAMLACEQRRPAPSGLSRRRDRSRPRHDRRACGFGPKTRPLAASIASTASSATTRSSCCCRWPAVRMPPRPKRCG